MARAPIGHRLRERRKALGMTQTELAAAVGVSASYVNLIEHDKRSIGGGLLAAMARVLELDLDSLTGAREARLIQALTELSADPLLRELAIPQRDAAELIGRFPEWGRAILTLYRAQHDSGAQVTALTDRLNRDSHFAAVGHQILTHITSIRSSAEILRDFTDLDDDRRRRFLAVVSNESSRLAEAARELFAFFEAESALARPASPAEEVDDVIIDHRNHFPTLETLADDLRRRVVRNGTLDHDRLVDHLKAWHGIACRVDGEAAAPRAGGCVFDPGARTFRIPGALPRETVRFQLAQLVATLEGAEAIGEVSRHARLHSDEARERMARSLAAYVAGAMLFPYEPFLEAAETLRYDLGLLQHRFRGSFEQVCHRLVTLRRPGASGIPFAFMRADPAGNVTKRFSIPGLSLPRYGTACPLWAVYQAAGAPDRTVSQFARLPDDSTFLFIARAMNKQATAFGKPPVTYSVMICCEADYAERIVLADGLDPAKDACVTEVGTSCRLCPREGCAQRAHPPVFEAA